MCARLAFRFGTGRAEPAKRCCLSPRWGSFIFPLIPMAYAMGCILPPLCGWDPAERSASVVIHAGLDQLSKNVDYPTDNVG